jgi:phosphatidylglycerol lysyltransferase
MPTACHVYQDCSRARALILRYGWNATAYQILNPGIAHWFTPEGDALVGYVRVRRVRVVAGAPVCDGDRLPEVLRAFEDEARARGERVCYFGAAGRVMDTLSDCPDYSTVVLGAQPVWDPAGWAVTIGGVASLRAQLSRARNKGVHVTEWTPDRATDSPELHRCLREWLQTRGLPPMRFLVEPFTLSLLDDRRIFVAERDGVAVGFVNLSPVPCRNGWLTEQFVRGRGAPNGTAELMIDAAMRAVAADGARYVTMGLVPLSRNTWEPERYNPLWLRYALTWVRAHGRRFYNFDGLDRFKAKFRPHAWEPIYAVSAEPRFSFETLYAIADAFSTGSAVRAVSLGLLRAVRQEARWVKERWRAGNAGPVTGGKT